VNIKIHCDPWPAIRSLQEAAMATLILGATYDHVMHPGPRPMVERPEYSLIEAGG